MPLVFKQMNCYMMNLYFVEVIEDDFEIRQEDGMNVLGLVVFSVALGVVTSRLGEVGKPLLHFSTAMAEASMILVKIVIWFVLLYIKLIWINLEIFRVVVK